MNIATSPSPQLRIVYDSAFAEVKNGPFSISSYIAYTGGAGQADHVCAMSFDASKAWTGETSYDGGNEARPSAVSINYWRRIQ